MVRGKQLNVWHSYDWLKYQLFAIKCPRVAMRNGVVESWLRTLHSCAPRRSSEARKLRDDNIFLDLTRTRNLVEPSIQCTCTVLLHASLVQYVLGILGRCQGHIKAASRWRTRYVIFRTTDSLLLRHMRITCGSGGIVYNQVPDALLILILKKRKKKTAIMVNIWIDNLKGIL